MIAGHAYRYARKPGDVERCPTCQERLSAGDGVVLLQLGPGRDRAAQQAAREGRAYTAVARPAHVECATGFAWEDQYG